MELRIEFKHSMLFSFVKCYNGRKDEDVNVLNTFYITLQFKTYSFSK